MAKDDLKKLEENKTGTGIVSFILIFVFSVFMYRCILFFIFKDIYPEKEDVPFLAMDMINLILAIFQTMLINIGNDLNELLKSK